jgi:hypothetical protein
MSKEKPLGRITYERLADSLLQIVKDQHVQIAQLEGTYELRGGLTVRDHIAIRAMQGIISSDRFNINREDLAYKAYIIADAMIAESQQSRGSDD